MLSLVSIGALAPLDYASNLSGFTLLLSPVRQRGHEQQSMPASLVTRAKGCKRCVEIGRMEDVLLCALSSLPEIDLNLSSEFQIDTFLGCVCLFAFKFR